VAPSPRIAGSPFGVRSLLGQTVTDDERQALEAEVREELMKKLIAGI